MKIDTDNAIEMMLATRNYACWYDMVIIMFRQDKPCLEYLLSVDDLKRECKLFRIRRTTEKAKDWGFLSIILVVQPSPEFIEMLTIGELDDCVIHSIEVAIDIYCESDDQANSENRMIQKHLRRKYCRTPKIDDYRGSTTKISARAIKECLFSDSTGYFGSNKNMLAIYARPSKFNGKPCIHLEFRIKGDQIKKRLKITNITDLLLFEQEEYFMGEAKNVVLESIDYRKLGMWILDWKWNRTMNKRDEMRISLAASTFISIFEIKTITDLINYFKDTQKVIRSNCGRRNRWQKNILALKNYNRFFVPL